MSPRPPAPNFRGSVVRLLNDPRCPLTPVAARYTEDCGNNFDIFLLEWLARYNKRFSGVYAA